jgi:L,D-peptidoglycan transpeptidase YkuD (ErfK/YbiS/YcfS/YnhG family)
VVLQLGGLVWGQQPLTVKSKLVTRNYKEFRIWTDSLDKRPKQWNMYMKFGMWNVRSLYRVGSLTTLSKELSWYRLGLVGVQEVRWEGSGTTPAGEYRFLYLKGNENHEFGTFSLYHASVSSYW